jgi:hypothetical protein
LSYNIPSGVGVRLDVQLSNKDWVCVAHSLVERCPAGQGPGVVLHDNAQWQDLKINIQTQLEEQKLNPEEVRGFRFIVPKNRYRQDSFWLDDIIIE